MKKFLEWLKGLFGGGIDLVIKDHRASFLFDNGGTRVMNLLAHNISEAQVNGVVNRCVGNGDKVIYLYIGYNNGDGAGTTSFYINDQFNGAIDNNKLNLMKNRIKNIQKKLKVIGWIFADDNGSKVNFKDTAALKKCTEVAIDSFNKYISEYVVALEANEYLSSSQVNELASLIKSKTKKLVGCHQTSGRYDYSASSVIDKHYHQYGFNKSNRYIQSETTKVKNALSKPVIGAEYDLSSDTPAAKARGTAVIAGGGSGTGNGRN